MVPMDTNSIPAREFRMAAISDLRAQMNAWEEKKDSSRLLMSVMSLTYASGTPCPSLSKAGSDVTTSTKSVPAEKK